MLGADVVVVEAQRFLLGECVQAYLPLDPQQQREFERLMATETYRGVQAMNTTWYEKGQEEARREDARKLVLAELDKLKIRSDTLNRQIEFLAQPVTKLSREELALLRQPVVSVSDQNSGVFKASFVFEKKSSANSMST